MRVVLGLILFCLLQTNAHAESWNLNHQDKQLHYGVAFTSAMTTTMFLEHYWKWPRTASVLTASIAVMAAATAKERYLDRYYSSADQLASGLGVASSAAFVWVFKF